jgi:hypothetical protein
LTTSSVTQQSRIEAFHTVGTRNRIGDTIQIGGATSTLSVGSHEKGSTLAYVLKRATLVLVFSLLLLFWSVGIGTVAMAFTLQMGRTHSHCTACSIRIEQFIHLPKVRIATTRYFDVLFW